MLLVSKAVCTTDKSSYHGHRDILGSFLRVSLHIFSFLQWAPCFDRRALSTLTTSLNHGIQRILLKPDSHILTPCSPGSQRKRLSFEDKFSVSSTVIWGWWGKKTSVQRSPNRGMFPLRPCQTSSMAQKHWKRENFPAGPICPKWMGGWMNGWLKQWVLTNL